MKVAIASPPFPNSTKDGLSWLQELVKQAAEKGAEIICFPESYIPGYPLEGHKIEQCSPKQLKAALEKVRSIAAEHNIAIILPMDWYEEERFLNVAFVVANTGEVLGYQAKNQLDPSEDERWMPGTKREIFELNGVKFGIVICHEGFRYPETVRWAARQGAQIVFHPHCTGSNISGEQLTEWGHKDSPYYEKAIMMRALENTIYFAASNYTMQYQESASALVAPDGTCLAHAEYGKPGVFVVDVDLDVATGILAKRLKSLDSV